MPTCAARSCSSRPARGGIPSRPAIPAALDRHGNPNVLTLDKGTSRLAQGPSAQTALVELERFDGPLPAVQAFAPPELIARRAVKVELAYGSDGLTVDLPGRPHDGRRAAAPARSGRRARRRARGAAHARSPGLRCARSCAAGATVAISICDGTRPQPREIVVPALLEELEGLVRLEDVVVLVATGTHRGNSRDELRAMLGDEVSRRVRVVNHDARDDASLTWMGRFGADVPVWLNSEWVEADVRITTGFVEPHFFAGFSGGPKLVAPGLAGLETTLTLHDAARIGHPDARWGVTQGNPVHDDVRAIAAATGTHFALDVVLDGEQRIAQRVRRRAVRDARGGLRARPADGDARRAASRSTSCSRRTPASRSTRTSTRRSRACRPRRRSCATGGTIVCAAECRDGFPDHGSYRDELTAAASPAALARGDRRAHGRRSPTSGRSRSRRTSRRARA